MPAPLSIIIPTLNAAGVLPALMQDLMEGIAAGMIREVILADGGSSDATAAIAEDTGARLVTTEPGRGIQLAEGCTAARADWLLILHADTDLPSNWPAVLRQHMQDWPEQAAAFRLSFGSRHPMARVTAGWANLRTRLFGLPYGDQGLLVPASLYRACGGYPDLRLMEDVAMARRLKGRIRLLPAKVKTSATRFEENGWLTQGTRNLWRLVRYLLGSKSASDPAGYDAAPPSNCKR